MKAVEMVITARMADHYEREGSKGSYDPLAHAETLFKQFKRSAPKLLQFLLDSQRSNREIGNWIWEFYGRWSDAGPIALKYFAEDELARLKRRDRRSGRRRPRSFNARSTRRFPAPPALRLREYAARTRRVTRPRCAWDSVSIASGIHTRS